MALALTGLENCSDRRSMIRVLENRGDIHSFDEFRARFVLLFGERNCPPPSEGTCREPDASAQARDRPGRGRRPVLGRLQDGLALARKAEFGKEPTKSRFVTRLPAQRRALMRGRQAILIRGLTRGIRAITANPQVRRERSTALFRTLTRRLSALRRARRRGRGIPAGLESLFAPAFANLDVAERVKTRPAPDPGSDPEPPPPDADTALSQTCQGTLSTNGGPPFTVTGKLEPAPGGATIRLVYTRPGGTSLTRTTTADAAGNYSDTIDPDQERGDGSPFGDWKVQSSFDGSAGFRSSQSTTCTVKVTD